MGAQSYCICTVIRILSARWALGGHWAITLIAWMGRTSCVVTSVSEPSVSPAIYRTPLNMFSLRSPGEGAGGV